MKVKIKSLSTLLKEGWHYNSDREFVDRNNRYLLTEQLRIFMGDYVECKMEHGYVFAYLNNSLSVIPSCLIDRNVKKRSLPEWF